MNLQRLPSSIFLIISTIILIQSAYAQDIQIIDVYSDIDSADITIHSDEQYSDISLDAELSLDGEVLRSHQFSIDEISPNSEITKLLFWDLNVPPKGAYHTKITLSVDGSELETQYFNFSYGSPTIPRIFIKDIVPDSSGVSVILAPYTSQLIAEPVLVDVVYMLLDGDTVVYRTTDRRVTVSQATPLSRTWNVRLENNHQYSARVKAKISEPREAVIAESKDFASQDDARITDLFRDETGASVTVLGMSQVPFEGDIVFTVTRNGKTMENINEKSPVLMFDDDETIEVIWDRRLAPGIYELSVKVMGNDEDILDKWDTIIESKESSYVVETPTPEPTKSPGFNLCFAVFSLIIVLLLSRRAGRHG